MIRAPQLRVVKIDVRVNRVHFEQQYMPIRTLAVRDRAELSGKKSVMFKSQQYRARAAKYRKLADASIRPEQRRRFQELEDRFVSLSNNERELSVKFDHEVDAPETDRAHGEALIDEEEHVLRCLGAAVIMQWNSVPTTLQREIFDNAGSVGRLLETASLRGQIARFLHKQKSDVVSRSSIRHRQSRMSTDDGTAKLPTSSR